MPTFDEITRRLQECIANNHEGYEQTPCGEELDLGKLSTMMRCSNCGVKYNVPNTCGKTLFPVELTKDSRGNYVPRY